MKEIDLKISNRDIKFIFGLGFLGTVLEKLDMDPIETQGALTKNPFKMVPLLMYYSAQYAQEREGRKLAFSLMDLEDWLDDTPGDFDTGPMADFLKAFNASMTKDVPVEKPAKGTPKVAKRPKKKLTGKVMS